MRNSFIFYRSYFEAIDNLPIESQLVLYKAVINYALDSNQIELQGINKSIFTLIKPTLDYSIKQYENGSKGGRPKKPNDNPDKTQNKPLDNPTHNPTNIDTNTNLDNNLNSNKDTNYNEDDNKEEKENISIKEKEESSERLFPNGKADKGETCGNSVSFCNEQTSNNNSPLISQKEEIITSEKIIKVFNKIYEHYPRKVNKVQAETTFEHKLVGMSLEEASKTSKEICKILQEQINIWIEEDRKKEFIPHFSTWLNDNVKDSPYFKKGRK